MKIVPYRNIIFGTLVALVVAIVLTVLLFGLLSSQPAPEDPISRDYQDSSSTPDLGDIEEVENVQYTEAGSLAASPVFIFVPLLSIVYITIVIVLIVAYRTVLNRGSLRKVINTALRLACFDYRIPRIGRIWQINDDMTMVLLPSKIQVRVKRQGPDPREFGLRSVGPWGIAECDLSSIQLTLQTVRLYLSTH